MNPGFKVKMPADVANAKASPGVKSHQVQGKHVQETTADNSFLYVLQMLSGQTHAAPMDLPVSRGRNTSARPERTEVSAEGKSVSVQQHVASRGQTQPQVALKGRRTPLVTETTGEALSSMKAASRPGKAQGNDGVSLELGRSAVISHKTGDVASVSSVDEMKAAPAGYSRQLTHLPSTGVNGAAPQMQTQPRHNTMQAFSGVSQSRLTVGAGAGDSPVLLGNARGEVSSSRVAVRDAADAAPALRGTTVHQDAPSQTVGQVRATGETPKPKAESHADTKSGIGDQPTNFNVPVQGLWTSATAVHAQSAVPDLTAAADSPSQTLQLDRPEWQHDLAGLVAGMNRNGQQEIRLHVRPAGMGDIHVSVVQVSTGMNVSVQASHLNVANMINQALPQISASLQEAGLTVSNLQVLFTGTPQPSTGQSSADGQPHSRQRNRDGWGTSRVSTNGPIPSTTGGKAETDLPDGLGRAISVRV
ncbi:MAG: flagellar hook-length control protein FliK [Alicyclobacillus sp.]|nr:flagellar hook-length control protein FliK [Alicyclobacillus sp.]